MSPADTNPAEGVEAALEDLDFDRAVRIADRAEAPLRRELLERVRTSRTEATDRAEKLAARIQFMARADHYEGLLALAGDPTTAVLLTLVSNELRRGATLHLEGAVRRQKRFRAAGRRHMKAAAEALLLLDTAKAAGELGKVEARWLTEAQRMELAELRDRIDQADVERMDIESRTAAVLREHAPDPTPGTPTAGDRRSRGLRMRAGGCLGSLAIALAVLTLTVIALVR